METIYVVNIMLGLAKTESFIKFIYTTNYSKYIMGTLVGANFKMPQKIGLQLTHRDPNPTLYKFYQWDNDPSFPLENITLDSA